MFKELVLKNRSVRRYDNSFSISRKQLEDLVELARCSPCAANLQNLRFYLSCEEEFNQHIFKHVKWANYLRYWDGPAPQEAPSAYILILCSKDCGKFHLLDTGIAAQTMLLGATELGLSGCMIASMDKSAIQTALGLPEEYDLVLTIALGKAAEKIMLEDVIDPDDIEYYRDDEGVHHVPKRSLRDLIIDSGK
ncbi:MAG TPA: nitroreductase family protein [Candidatus Cloacimonadota bacterium]|nr:nitroreductase family protein [Candidatus Cloacimonadota bacterium]